MADKKINSFPEGIAYKNNCIMLYRTISLAEDLKGKIIYRLNEKEDVFDD